MSRRHQIGLGCVTDAQLQILNDKSLTESESEKIMRKITECVSCKHRWLIYKPKGRTGQPAPGKGRQKNPRATSKARLNRLEKLLRECADYLKINAPNMITINHLSSIVAIGLGCFGAEIFEGLARHEAERLV